MPRGNLARLLCRVLVDVSQMGWRQSFPRVQKAFALRASAKPSFRLRNVMTLISRAALWTPLAKAFRQCGNSVVAGHAYAEISAGALIASAGTSVASFATDWLPNCSRCEQHRPLARVAADTLGAAKSAGLQPSLRRRQGSLGPAHAGAL